MKYLVYRPGGHLVAQPENIARYAEMMGFHIGQIHRGAPVIRELEGPIVGQRLINNKTEVVATYVQR